MYVRNTLKLKELQPDCEELLDFLDRLGDGQQDHSVLRLHHGIPARNYDLALSDDGADYDTGRQLELLDFRADQRRRLQGFGLDDLGEAVAQGMHRFDAAAPDVLQNGRDGDRPRIHQRIDPKRGDQRGRSEEHTSELQYIM